MSFANGFLLSSVLGTSISGSVFANFLTAEIADARSSIEKHVYPSSSGRMACEYHNYRKYGFSICAEGDVVEALHFYNNSQGFARFAGLLPYGLRIDMSNREVVELLGEPEVKTGGGRAGPITIGYGEQTLQCTFVGCDWNDAENPIDCLTMYTSS